MLKLSDIRKSYVVGDNRVEALRGVELEFRENEFVSVLGPSGCGKTTLLNLIGGLDRYTSGDLIINGKSTKQYTDKDWDTYRNHSVGFVFQSYNLIPHQTVLSNVELALTLSGVSKSERRRRAKEALEKVGLGDQLSKKPNQMSGGQMQRVAIARALINDPDILLADEPTGALDSETSVQVMALLKEVAQDRLVIMVTHNPELAEEYSTRIVRLKDGQVVGDTDPYRSEQDVPALTGKQARAGKRTSMSFFTAFGLSLNNLMTKKGRTFLTSFAGSIGIIGIALIMALSNGINTYIDKVQQDTLSSYPITIQAESVDTSAMLLSFMGNRQQHSAGENGQPKEEDRVYSSTVMFDMVDAMFNAETEKNNLKAFKEYLEAGGGGISDLAAVRYGYDFSFDIYTRDTNGKIVKSDVMTLLQEGMSIMYGGDYSSYFSTMGAMYQSMDVWEELMPGEDGALISEQVTGQNELLYGKWPESYDEVVLFVNRRNEISDLMLYALGFISSQEMSQGLLDMMEGKEVDVQQRSWGYDELCGMTFKLILPAEYWQKDAATGTYVDMSRTETGMDFLYNSDSVGITLKLVGIARPSGDGDGMQMAGAIGYAEALTTYAIDETAKMAVVQEQMANPATDVLKGLPFATGDEIEPTDGEKRAAIREYLSGLSVQEKAAAYTDVMSQPSEEYVQRIVEQQTGEMTRADIEEMIVGQYAGEMGVDGDTVKDYIAKMSDEDLFARVREAVAAGVRQQYGELVSRRLGALSADQLAEMLDKAMEEESGTLSAAALRAAAGLPEGFDPDQLPEGFDLGGLLEGIDPSQLPEGFDPSQLPEDLDLGGLLDGLDPSQIPEGFDLSQLPEDLDLGGLLEGIDPGQLPEGFDPSALEGLDPSQLPEGFDPSVLEGLDPSQIPEGFDPSQLPEDLDLGGLLEGIDPSQIPEGFDPSQLPEGFDPSVLEGVDPSQIPEGFDPGQLPEGFDPSVLEGLNPSQIPEGFDPSALGGLMGQTDAPFEAWQFNYLYDHYMPATLSDSNYEAVLDKLGYVDSTSPSTISIYASTFADKDRIADLISAYNDTVPEEDRIKYTDYVALLMSSITDIISGISYLLIAFVSISLVVSSIMIGIITYISVLERTKEIGILRAVGASKRDISRVFNAETLIVGLGAGLIGIGVTVLLTFPLNAILHHVTNIAELKARLPVEGGAILVAISAVLTIISGLIPSGVAARKDPVEALRTE